MPNDYLLEEDTNRLLLEDGSGDLLLESSIVENLMGAILL